ncbi:glucuronate isomerase [Butyrivibrio sp. WCD3002]|uniref:glucuronate isomerase n=1 Tax=Butyrivibrio sp. WCD3002 TaxID=1280676 RepID=UPI0003F8505B|nr:glucuronate isomerase [Butyrivibrio sp. WCD3002]
MKQFLDKDFVLQTETAKHLFHDYAKDLPIIDYHCHISPQEIYEDRRFETLADVWLGGYQPDGSIAGDHYKWRLMRSNGMPEELVTGRGDDFARFKGFAEVLTKAIGNSMYHWCNLELQKYFGITEPLTPQNAEKIWNKCNDKLKNDPQMSVRGLIKQSNVEYVGTTDDPIDSLIWHEKIAEDKTIDFLVRPSFRPDKAVNIHKEGFAEYIKKLAKAVNKESLDSTQDVIDALIERVEFFAEHGCVASDHGLDYVPFRKLPMEECDKAFKKAMNGEAVTVEEAEGYQTALLVALGKAYHRLGITMELHYSCLRNINERQFKTLGPDTGYDAMANNSCGGNLAAFLSELDKTEELPKTIVFSLNPADNEQIGTIIGGFQSAEVPGKIQHGPAWWFNDSKSGMEEQMKSLANLGLLGNFIGMLTDSRSFLSYTRHDYFRRIMCNLIGNWVENGEYPNDDEALKSIVQGISYYNAKRYFGL